MTHPNCKPPPLRPSAAPTLGLFEKRLDGDDSLLELARLRFQQADMGAEMHAGSPDQLEQMLQFRPSAQAPIVVHLPRNFNLLEESSRYKIGEFACHFAGRVRGFVIHDHATQVERPKEYFQAARELESRLARIDSAPILFVEYAAGLEPSAFVNFFREVRDLAHVSACIDVGHVGIRQARTAFAEIHPGQDVCNLKSDPSNLPPPMPDISKAVATALPAVLELIGNLGALGKPLHFHLHDGHPLSTFSPFGVSDHLSFFAEIPLAFEFQGRRSAPLMFGPTGLACIVSAVPKAIGADLASFTLEIHPTFEREPLGDAASLFNHWTDKTNAEKMNRWLAVLARNHELLRSHI